MKQLKKSFLYSLKRTIPILIGYFPVGIAFGILMADAGYNFIWSSFTSIVVYAGSLQMLMVSFFSENLSLLSIIVTTLLLNSRHIFYGLSFIEKLRDYGFWKYLIIYGLSDENYSLLCSYKEVDGVSEKWVHIFSTCLIWIYWVIFSALGGLIGQMLPFDTTGIDFALTALFIVIVIEQLKDASTKMPALITVLSSVSCLILFGANNFLLPSLLLTIMILILMQRKLEPQLEEETNE